VVEVRAQAVEALSVTAFQLFSPYPRNNFPPPKTSHPPAPSPYPQGEVAAKSSAWDSRGPVALPAEPRPAARGLR
jgi:hypothetical protein